jgi:CRISPR-associated protein Cas1
MANNHVISIEREAKLSISIRRLEILFSKNNERHYFAPFDIAVLILAHPCISLSVAVPKELSLAGTVIVYAGDNYMPVGITLPVTINTDGAKRPHLQAKYINTQFSEVWWKQVIKSKILGNACVLREFAEDESYKLVAIAGKIIDGDKDNKEGIAAKFYWEVYFSKLNYNISGRRKRGAEDIVNASLNYSYAILRSMIARSLVSAGLCLNFGIGHSRKDNPFNLVEDFIEPFRFIADKIVFKILSVSEYNVLNVELKKVLLSNILAMTVLVNGNTYRLFQAIDFAINSFCLSLEDSRYKLLLPNMHPTSGVQVQMVEPSHINYEN